MPFGGGSGYAQGLRNIEAEKRALMGAEASLLSNRTDAINAQANLFQSVGSAKKAAAEASAIEQEMRANTAVGAFMSDFFQGMMEKDPQTGRPVFRPEFRASEAGEHPDLGVLTEHLYSTLAKHKLDAIGAEKAVDLLTKEVDIAPKIVEEWLDTSKKILEKQALTDAKAARERVQSAQSVEEKKKALTDFGLAAHAGGIEGTDLGKLTAEGMEAGKARTGSLAKYTVLDPASGSVTTYAVPVGETFVPPEGQVVINPDATKGLPAEAAAKVAGVELWRKNWPQMQEQIDELFGDDVSGLGRQKNIMHLTHAKGRGSPELTQLYVAARQGVETQLRLLSGAAIPPEEVDMAVGLFLPQLLDDAETIKFRFSQLNKFLNFTHGNVDPQGRFSEGEIDKNVLLNKITLMAVQEPSSDEPVSADPSVKDFIEEHTNGN